MDRYEWTDEASGAVLSCSKDGVYLEKLERFGYVPVDLYRAELFHAPCREILRLAEEVERLDDTAEATIKDLKGRMSCSVCYAAGRAAERKRRPRLLGDCDRELVASRRKMAAIEGTNKQLAESLRLLAEENERLRASAAASARATARFFRGLMEFVGWNVQVEFKIEDFWIGAFWKRVGNCLDVWVCLIPCFPVHLSWWWHDPAEDA